MDTIVCPRRVQGSVRSPPTEAYLARLKFGCVISHETSGSAYPSRVNCLPKSVDIWEDRPRAGLPLPVAQFTTGAELYGPSKTMAPAGTQYCGPKMDRIALGLTRGSANVGPTVCPASKYADERCYQVRMVYTKLRKLVWLSCLWESGGNCDVLCDV